MGLVVSAAVSGVPLVEHLEKPYEGGGGSQTEGTSTKHSQRMRNSSPKKKNHFESNRRRLETFEGPDTQQKASRPAAAGITKQGLAVKNDQNLALDFGQPPPPTKTENGAGRRPHPTTGRSRQPASTIKPPPKRTDSTEAKPKEAQSRFVPMVNALMIIIGRLYLRVRHPQKLY